MTGIVNDAGMKETEFAARDSRDADDHDALCNVPEALRKHTAWVVWRREFTESGKPTKVPYRALVGQREHASSTNAATWTTFDTALDALVRDDHTGLGYVFERGRGVVGIDLDHCRDPETGVLAPWAERLVHQLDSYTEASPSGEGVHIFVAGSWTGMRHRWVPDGLDDDAATDAHIEVYDTARFFTVTGYSIVGASRNIEERQEALDALAASVADREDDDDDDGDAGESGEERAARIAALRAPLTDDEARQVGDMCDWLDRNQQEKPDHRTRQLWRGEWDRIVNSNGKHRYSSQSNADLGLLTLVVLRYPDASDRAAYEVWRRSGLARGKQVRWDYAARTLRRARQHERRHADSGSAPVSVAKVGGYYLNDAGNAQRFYDLFHDDLLYVVGTNTPWHAWDGQRWVPDAESRAVALACTLTQHLLTAIEAVAVGNEETERLSSEKEKAAARQFAIQSGNGQRIRNVVALAAHDARFQVRREQMDAQPELLNFPNGTLSLETREFRPHDRRDLLTQVAAASYDPEASNLLFEGTLRRFFPKEPVRRYLQQVFGKALTGHPKREFYLVWGGTNTGKSTLLEVAVKALGDYACITASDTFLKLRDGSQGGARADLMALYNKRLVAAKEIQERATANTAFLKNITGGDTLTARGLYERQMTEWTPRYTLLWGTNYLPQVPLPDPNDKDDPAHAMWERMVVIPAEEYITPEERSDEVYSQLVNADITGAAVLAWMVTGYWEYRESGRLLRPTEVVDAIRLAQNALDPFGDYFDECCAFGDQRTSLEQLYTNYTYWCRLRRRTPRSRKALAAALRRRGCKTTKGEQNGATSVLGVRIERFLDADGPLVPLHFGGRRYP